METTTVSPRIYVASLSDYNAGRLHGVWLDADQEPEELHAEIQAMLKESKEYIAEEWAIHDHEGFDGLSISEWESMAVISAYAELLREFDGKIIAHAIDCVSNTSNDKDDIYDELLTYIQDNYMGEYDDEADYAHCWHEECGYLENVPECLAYHIDWQNVARDMDHITFIPTGGRGVYVFYNG